MSDSLEMLVVLFFETNETMSLFLQTGDVDFTINRKLIQASCMTEVTADYINEVTDVTAPIMLVYPLIGVEPLILKATKTGRINSAS